MISLDDFDYNLPEELIAQTPLLNREECRLLCLNKETGETDHKHFYDIYDMLHEGDVLVMNDSKVIPARLFGIKKETNAHIELLMLKDLGNDIWQTLVKPARRVKVGTRVVFGDGLLSAICVEEREEGIRHFKMEYEGIFLEVLDKLGETPLPPYIHEHLDDPNMYQTVYAKNPGSAAAPTAGLHFTKDLLKKLEEKGVTLVYVTLHVGLGTFRPVNEGDITKHKMHSEYYEISKESAEVLNKALEEKRRIISVGTTSTRVLESAYNNGYKECFGYTDIFIYPGYKWKAVNALITNFHLPKSTLVMLVSSLAGRENILNAYKEAVENKYRFFSFGDAMFIY